jgi:hypothetical protein
MEKPRTRPLLALPLVVRRAELLPVQSASWAPPDPDRVSRVRQFNLAVGMPGECQRTFHQDEPGRAVSYFAHLSEDERRFSP